MATPLKMSIRLSGEDPQALTELLVEGVSDYRDLWPRTARLYRVSQARRFRTQGRSAGTPWPRPSETGERDVYRFVKAAILGMTPEQIEERALLWAPGRERLRPSFVSATHPEHVDTRRATSQELGSRVPYARDHDRGRGRAPRHLGGHPIPRRDLTSLGRRFRRELLAEVAGWARDVAQRAEADVPRLRSEDVRRLRGR